jgi:hypothetical protein
VEDIADLEIAGVEVEIPESLPKRYYVRIPLRQETYEALRKLKEAKRMTWDGVVRWLIEVARAKKSQLVCKEEDLGVEKFLSILNILGIDLSSLIGGRKK